MKFFCLWIFGGRQKGGVFLVYETQKPGVYCVQAGKFLSHSELNRGDEDKKADYVAAGRFDENGDVKGWSSKGYGVETPDSMMHDLAAVIKTANQEYG